MIGALKEKKITCCASSTLNSASSICTAGCLVRPPRGPSPLSLHHDQTGATVLIELFKCLLMIIKTTSCLSYLISLSNSKLMESGDEWVSWFDYRIISEL